MPCDRAPEPGRIEAVLSPVWRTVAAVGGAYECIAIVTQALQRRGYLEAVPKIPTISDWYEMALFVESRSPAVRWGLQLGVTLYANIILDHLYQKDRTCYYDA